MEHKIYHYGQFSFGEHRLTYRVSATLTREVLEQTMHQENPLDALKALITQNPEDNNNPYGREQQVERAKTAASIIGASETIIAAEKQIVIEASNAVLQEAMSAVTTELQATTIQADLLRLQAERDRIVETREQVQKIEYELSTLAERVQMDMRRGGLGIKTAYIVGIVGGVAVASWVWKHTIGWAWKKLRGMFAKEGEEPTEGFLGAVGKWGSRLGGAIAGVLGINWALDKFYGRNPEDNSNPLWDMARRVLPASVVDAAEGAGDKLEDGMAVPIVALGEAGTALMQHEHTAEVLRKAESEEYETETEYWGALIIAMGKDGIDVICDEGKVLLYIGGNLIKCNTDFWSKGYKLLTEGLEAREAGELFGTYVGGIFIYATNLAALKLITLGKLGGKGNLLKESFAWPYYSLKRAGVGAWKVTRMTMDMASSSSPTRLAISRNTANFKLKYQMRTGTLMSRMRGATAEGLHMRLDFMRAQKQLLENARGQSRISAEALRKFETLFTGSANDALKYIQRMNPENIPDWFKAALQETYPGRGIKSLTSDELYDIFHHVNDEALARGASVVDEVIPPTGATPRGGAGGTGTADEVLRSADEVVPPAGTGAADEAVEAGARTATRTDEALRVAGATVSGERIATALGANLADAPKAAEAVRRIGMNVQLADALDDSEQFAKVLAQHLENVDDPARALMRINTIAESLDDPLLLSRVCFSDAQLTRIINMADDVATIPTTFAKLSDAIGEIGGLSPKLLSVMDDSPKFAQALLSHLDKADDPLVALRAFNSLADTIDDPLIIGKLVTNEARFARVLAKATDGPEAMARTATAFSKTAKIMKMVQAAGVVADAFAIYVTVQDIIHTSSLIDAAEDRGSTDEYISQLRTRYAYHAAELGVATTGLVAGGAVLLGVGGTVAAPVALATLPISAVIYGAYQGHRWEEDKTRSATDWAAENSLVQLLVDARSYDFGERVGHAWWMATSDGEWIYTLTPSMGMHGLASGRTQERAEELATDIQSVNEEMIRGMVIHTTTVGVPTKVMGENGEPRNLTEEEAAYYKASAEAYIEAKVAYIMNQIKEVQYAISSYADVAKLMRDAEDYALLAQAEQNYKANEEELPEGWPSSDLNMEERARAYGALRRKQIVSSLYMETLIAMSLGSDTPDALAASMRADFEQKVQEHLIRESQPIVTKFELRCQEENMIDWWSDGNAPAILETYMGRGFNKILQEQTQHITTETLANIQNELAAGNIEGYRQNPVEQLEQALKDAVQKIDDHYLDQSARELWDGMPKQAKDDLTEERDWDSNPYVLQGFERLNTAMRNTLMQAESVLDTQTYNQAVTEIHAIHGNRQLSVLEKDKRLRAIQIRLSDQIQEASTSGSSIQQAPNVIRSRLRIPGNIRVLASINRASNYPSDTQVAEYLRRAFGTHKNDGSYRRYRPGDIILYQFTHTGRGSMSLSETHFFGGTTGRIRRRTSQLSFGRGTDWRLDNSQAREESLSEWEERNRNLVADSRNNRTALGEALDAVDEDRRQAAVEAELARVERERASAAARVRAQQERGVFVPIEEGAHSHEYQIRYEDRLVTYNTPSTAPAVSALETGTFWHKNRDEAVFEVQYDNGGTLTFTISNIDTYDWENCLTPGEKETMSSREQRRVGAERLKMIHYLIATPLENDERQSVHGILQLVSGQSYRPGSFASNFYNPRFYVYELETELMPLYRRADDKRAFLTSLLNQVSSKGEITKTTGPQILAWFKRNMSRFE